MLRALLLLSLSCTLPSHALSAECSDDTMRRCRRDVLMVLNSNGLAEKEELKDQCRQIRENFDCVLWQISKCLDKDEQDANGDIILKSWRYMTTFCEDQGSWWTKSCYQREEVKQCEALLSSKGHAVDSSSCRSFRSFRDCVTSVVEARCSRVEQRLLGTYLMDKGQQRAWRCPKDTGAAPASAPLEANDPSYSSCMTDSRGPLQECQSDYEIRQHSAQRKRDSDMRNHETCCAVVRYEDCVGRILREKCGEYEGNKETRNIVASSRSRYYGVCDDHTMDECSGVAALVATASFTIALLCVALQPLLFSTGF